MNVRITEPAEAYLERIVRAAREDSPENALRIVQCFEGTYSDIVADPTVGVPAPSAYEGSRMVQMNGYDAFLVVFIVTDEGVTVVGVMNSWMAGI